MGLRSTAEATNSNGPSERGVIYGLGRHNLCFVRLGMISSGLWPEIGGVERYVWRLAVELASLGVEVDVLTPGERTEESLVDGVRINSYARPLDRLRDVPPPTLFWGVFRSKFDLVHGHHYHQPHVLAAALRGSCPLVYTTHFHGEGSTRLRSLLHGLYRPLGSSLLCSADVLIVNTPAEARLVSDRFGSQTDDRIIALPPGHEEFPRRPTESLVLCVGRLVATKRVDRFVELCAATSLPSGTRCLIIGDGPERLRLERLARTLDAPVEFTGRVTDATLAELIGRAKILVSFSEQESWGMAVADAAAAGVRVLASDIAAHRFVASLAENSVSVIRSNLFSEWLSVFEESLVGNPPEPVHLPSWRDVAQSHLEIYESLLNGLFVDLAALSPWGDWRQYA